MPTSPPLAAPPTRAPATAPATVPATAPDDHRAWLDLLAGDGAAGVLGAALAADGSELESWSVRQVHARPGAEVTVAYEVVARRAGAGGTLRAREHLCASSAPGSVFRRARGAVRDGDPLGPGVVRLDDGGRSLHVWRHPHDPALPGLAAGSTPAGVRERLRAAGVDAEVLALETVTYRPLRRAVLRARTTAGTVYVKVVRPSRADALVRRHVLLAGADGVVAPRVLGGPEAPGDGVVLLTEVPGASVADLLARTPAAGRADCLDPAEVLRVARGLPAAGVSLPPRAPWADRLDHYLGALAALHGADPGRLARLGARIGAVVDARDPGPVVTTHGDLHAANLLLDPASSAPGAGRPARVRGLLDADTLGPGHLVDDLACAVAHLAVLPALAPAAYAGTEGLVVRCLDVFGGAADPALLRARAAAVVVSLAAGADTAARAAAFLAVAERLAADAAAF
ncbi:aminoglycoside phosphotransferase family protein [Isoptericola sp. NPDC057559]|uniref:aminoglycoside phosphotransferase family protein n=1 Tax=Isoptericola sp. NPDC057559 TaxID=3346168 RepID=UPI0036AB24AE